MIGNLSFAAPWLLGFFAALPLLWWLLRLMPPAPHKIIFPALELLRGLTTPQQLPAHTPWWLLLLRLAIAALLILGFAQPVMNAHPVALATGPMLIAVDNDWAAARDWPLRQKALHDLIREAERDRRPVILLPTAPAADGNPLQLLGPIAAEAALAEADRLTPEPWPSDWPAATDLLQTLDPGSIGSAYWLAGGLAGADARGFLTAINRTGDAHILGDAVTPIYLLAPPQRDTAPEAETNDAESGFILTARRAATDSNATANLAALDKNGHILASLPLTFTAGAPSATAKFDLPLETYNRIARFEVEGTSATTAATTVLVGTGWQHPAVGLAGDKAELDQHSLLSDLFYLDRALKPYADIHVAPLDELLKENIAVLILTDKTDLHTEQISQLAGWIKRGGILVRFAGEHLAAGQIPQANNLLPVALRIGDRALGGTLSWTTPQTLQPFPDQSPFAGLPVPSDVTVKRQILAEPSPDMAPHVWAALTDGTPLVTAKNSGRGVSVLFHVPAGSDWSNLALSGLFVSMLKRILDLSHNSGDAHLSAFSPLNQMDAFGELHPPAPAAQSLSDGDFASAKIGPQHPPGLYGSDAINRALNLGQALGQPEGLRDVPVESYQRDSDGIALQPALLTASFLLLLLDFLISLRLRGKLAWPQKLHSVVGILVLILFATSAHAANDEKPGVKFTSKTYLAYVETGNREIDRVSASGLVSLARMLQRRTSLDQIDIAGVNPDTDDLAFFPLLYWPVTAGEPPLSAEGTRHVNDYLHHGGMILFDSMNGEAAPPGLLQHIMPDADIPPLVQLPQNHVLKRTFYLLDEFPGRYASDDFWVEPEDMASYDGVATVLAGNNGWAAAWATDSNGQPLFPCIPGGEAQRERAFRFGVNLAMYALTGNYKDDQLKAGMGK